MMIKQSLLITVFGLLLIPTLALADQCENIRFEAQDVICNLEASLSADAAGTRGFNNAVRKKIACQQAFLSSCRQEVVAGGTCEAIRFEAQDQICNLEARDSQNAAGTPHFQDALKRKLSCQAAFLKVCVQEWR